ncbi:MAG: bis(5'-nucleosyl)-tetraphosphatase (symmetrical) YqeK [Lachnospiraceae bacterium]|nr:bis(5'-nucleosyl)-tetraphosphatase (symmetrical) YqeK [Lachnospiraceae bacterium]
MQSQWELEEQLKKVLNEKRFRHTLGVSDTAAALTMAHGGDLQKARLAGVLHDCAKCYSDAELLAYAQKFQLPITEVEEQAAYLLHGKVGAYFAEHLYGVTDEDVLNSIRFHTTGRVNMTQLEKIIFIADYIEPTRREIPGLDQCRAYAFQDLNLATYEILKNTLQYLEQEQKPSAIDPNTRITMEYYKELSQNTMDKISS